MSWLSQVRIVLSHTSHPGNIGACARAMKNMGLSNLYLVNPKVFPDSQATDRAAGADDILERAMVVSDLSEALQGCRLVLGTSARVRAIPWPLIDPVQAAEKVAQVCASGPVAILFGHEKSGLKNHELQLCQAHIYIPTDPIYSSLNLGAAVQVICYELRKRLQLPLPPSPEDKLATADDLKYFYEHLEATLIENKFLHPEHPKQIMTRLRRLFSRVELEDMEVQLLRGILTAFQKT